MPRGDRPSRGPSRFSPRTNMTHNRLPLGGRGPLGLSLLLGSLVFGAPVRADAPALAPQRPDRDPARAPLIPPDLVLQPGPASAAPQSAPGQRLRLFRIQPGFLSDPIGLDQDDGPPEPTPDRVNFAFGNDNPYFDFRRRNDPGGVGFMRANTQVLLFDSSATAVSLGLQAVTPSGLDYDGVAENKGATVVTPALSLFHALDDTHALQAFVGKNVPVMNRAAGAVRTDLQYGMAVQRPLVPEGPDLLRNLFVSVGAVGQLRPDRPDRAPMLWEVLPGLHYRMADNWWISGGVSMPVGPAKGDTGQQWQVTCSLQF